MEHILLRLAFAPGLDTAVDAYFAYSDCTRASREPTLENRAWCGADLGFLALPLIGAAWARAGARIADAVPWGRADDVPLRSVDNGPPLRPMDNTGGQPPRLTVDAIMRNPDLLRPAPGRLLRRADASDLIADAKSKGWRVTTLGEGTQEGRGLRMLGPHDGQTIRYHPAGGHHGTYWYVASGTIGGAWVHPWWTIWVKRAR